jgi:alanine racemase
MESDMPRPISATISLASLTHNLRTVENGLGAACRKAGRRRPKIWAVIKANAYGHGIPNAVRAFASADGLAMLDLNEAVLCRELGWDKPVMLLEGLFEPDDVTVLDENRLVSAVHSFEQIDILAASRVSRPLDVFIKLNTGMNRLGFSARHYADACRRLSELQEKGIVRLVGKMSHFARADDDPEVTRSQMDIFMKTTGETPGMVSVCNSAAALTPSVWCSAPDDGSEQWVRPGICLYGASPFDGKSADQLGLRPAQTLASRLISVCELEPGGSVGYGHTFTASETMRIGVVACGYADGYPRHAGTGTPVTIDGTPTRTLGRVSMDMLVVDLTPVPHAGVGSKVVLWGEGGPSVDEVAKAAGTIGYELLCAVAPRVPKFVV